MPEDEFEEDRILRRLPLSQVGLRLHERKSTDDHETRLACGRCGKFVPALIQLLPNLHFRPALRCLPQTVQLHPKDKTFAKRVSLSNYFF